MRCSVNREISPHRPDKERKHRPARASVRVIRAIGCRGMGVAPHSRVNRMTGAVTVLVLVLVAAPTARAEGAHPKRRLGILVSVATFMQAVQPGAQTLSLTTPSGKTFAMSGAELGAFSATLVEPRVRIAYGPFRFGPVVAAGPAWVPAAGDRAAHLESYGVGLLTEWGAAFGVALPRWRWLQPEVEVVGGFTALTLRLFHPDAVNATGGVAREAGWASLLLQPRAALDAWLGAHVTLGVWATDNLCAAGQPSVGLALTYHPRPHDDEPQS